MLRIGLFCTYQVCILNRGCAIDLWRAVPSMTFGVQVCCPREDGWDSGAGAVVNKDWHGISQRRVLMRTDFAVRVPVLHLDLEATRSWSCFDGVHKSRCIQRRPSRPGCDLKMRDKTLAAAQQA